MMQLKQKQGRIMLHEKKHFATFGGTSKNGHLCQPGLILEQLKQAVQDKGWHGRHVCLAMENRACYMRTITMPQLKKRELKQALFWEAKKHLPFNIDEAVVSYINIALRPGQVPATSNYLLAATPKETANMYTSLAAEAGLIPISLETPSTAWLRSITGIAVNNNHSTQKHRLFVDCGYSTTLLLLTLDNRYCFHRIIHLGIKHFIQAVQVRYGRETQEALRYVYSKGDLAEKGLLTEAGKLAYSINESLGYWSELYRDNPLKPAGLTLSGGGMLIPELALYLQQKLGVKTSLYNPFASINCGHGEDDSGLNNKHENTLFSTAHGLSLRGWLK